jgi:hypothetical protein
MKNSKKFFKDYRLRKANAKKELKQVLGPEAANMNFF